MQHGGEEVRLASVVFSRVECNRERWCCGMFRAGFDVTEPKHGLISADSVRDSLQDVDFKKEKWLI